MNRVYGRQKRRGRGKRRRHGRKNSPWRGSPLQLWRTRQEEAGGRSYPRQRHRLSIHFNGCSDHVLNPRRTVGSRLERGRWHEGPLRREPAQCCHRLAGSIGQARGAVEFPSHEPDLRSIAILSGLRHQSFVAKGTITFCPHFRSRSRPSKAPTKAAQRRPPHRRWLNFPANRRMITMQTNLSALVAVSTPAGGEMSGLTAHFLFGAKVAPPKRTTRGKHSGSTAAERRRP